MKPEDALGWFVTLDDALFFSSKGLMRLSPDTASWLPEKLQKVPFAAYIIEHLESIREGWDILLSVPCDMQNDDGSIRLPSKYEGFLDDYEDL